MKRHYTVSKDEKSGLWYAHKAGFPWIPVLGTFSKTKRAAQLRLLEISMKIPNYWRGGVKDERVRDD